MGCLADPDALLEDNTGSRHSQAQIWRAAGSAKQEVAGDRYAESPTGKLGDRQQGRTGRSEGRSVDVPQPRHHTGQGHVRLSSAYQEGQAKQPCTSTTARPKITTPLPRCVSTHRTLTHANDRSSRRKRRQHPRQPGCSDGGILTHTSQAVQADLRGEGPCFRDRRHWHADRRAYARAYARAVRSEGAVTSNQAGGADGTYSLVPAGRYQNIFRQGFATEWYQR